MFSLIGTWFFFFLFLFKTAAHFFPHELSSYIVKESRKYFYKQPAGFNRK
ncbi:hypothetical protein N288_18220 [Bacillus infantis NRRL B-14911]|uniref:Uncharacterized protein n=1 Tax=Bacillus infantis NRRL B-14911 TaxID=1367477 RepID=U5LFQ2_9BACI|nr:hypothetical protein N288_18220 [Bacillus infantis NRRL B-14911]